MNLVRIHYVEKLVNRAQVEIRLQNYAMGWKLLEAAHIFAQPYAAMHLCVHWEMFALAFRQRDFREGFGQIPRLLLALPASWFRKYPIGNTGRSNVGMFTSMKLSEQVAKKIRDLEKKERERIESGGVLKKHQRQHPLTRR